MKKFVFLLILLLLTFNVKFYKAKAVENLALQNQIIIKDLEVDLTGDKKVENVILSGSQKEGSPLYENIKITVSDNKTGLTLFSITPTTNFGFEPTIFLGDFTGDGLPELFYGASNGSCDLGYYYLYSFNDKALTLYDYESDLCLYKAVFRDWYNLEIYNNVNSYKIDISKKDYLHSIYKEGQLIKSVNGEISKVSRVSPYYDSSKEIYMLSVVRKITGLYPLDVIGYLVENYSYEGNENVIKESCLVVI